MSGAKIKIRAEISQSLDFRFRMTSYISNVETGIGTY